MLTNCKFCGSPFETPNRRKKNCPDHATFRQRNPDYDTKYKRSEHGKAVQLAWRRTPEARLKVNASARAYYRKLTPEQCEQRSKYQHDYYHRVTKHKNK